MSLPTVLSQGPYDQSPILDRTGMLGQGWPEKTSKKYLSGVGIVYDLSCGRYSRNSRDPHVFFEQLELGTVSLLVFAKPRELATKFYPRPFLDDFEFQWVVLLERPIADMMGSLSCPPVPYISHGDSLIVPEDAFFLGRAAISFVQPWLIRADGLFSKEDIGLGAIPWPFQ